MRNAYDKRFREISKQKDEDWDKKVTQFRELATLSGAIYALDKVIELVEGDMEGDEKGGDE
jgi:hypothetical protein